MEQPLAETLHQWMRVVMRHSMHNFIRFAKENNFSMAQINALFRISHKGTCGVSDLGDELGITSAAASQLLEKLVQQGLVQRSEDPQDRRNKRIILTDSGNRLLQESIQARQGWLNQLAACFSPVEQEQINQALQLLIEKSKLLGEDEAEPDAAHLPIKLQ
ncbi:MAG: MarR family winged helix-turn-helix transcriptional regulator [Anaerolineales bacterium]